MLDAPRVVLVLLRAVSKPEGSLSAVVVSGVAVMLFIQVVENVGMNIGVLPIAGIPLPFISYGGSATVTSLAALGVVQSVVMRRRTVKHRDPVPLEIPDPTSGTVRITL